MYLWPECKVIHETVVLHKSYSKSYNSFPSKLITKVVPNMVLSLPITQDHSGGPFIVSLSCEMPSSHCCPHCTTACGPHLNPRLFFLSYSLCSGCLCLYHPSSMFFGHFGNQQNPFRGVYEMETKWRVKGKDHLYSVKQCCSSRNSSSQKSSESVTMFHETSLNKILLQENINMDCIVLELIWSLFKLSILSTFSASSPLEGGIPTPELFSAPIWNICFKIGLPVSLQVVWTIN